MKASGKGLGPKLILPLVLAAALLLGAATAIGHGRHLGWSHAAHHHDYHAAHGWGHPHRWVRPHPPAYHHARPVRHAHHYRVPHRPWRSHVARHHHYVAAGAGVRRTEARRAFGRARHHALHRSRQHAHKRARHHARKHTAHHSRASARSFRSALVSAYLRALRNAYSLAERLARQAFVRKHIDRLHGGRGHINNQVVRPRDVRTNLVSLQAGPAINAGPQATRPVISGALNLAAAASLRRPTATTGSASRVFGGGVPLRPALATARPGLTASSTQPARTATAGTTAGAGARTRAARAKTAAATTHHSRRVSSPAQGPSVIQRIERVVPGFVWLALGISAALAVLGGGAMFWSGYRMRSQAGQFAAVAAAAMTDPLTGILNRRGFIDAAERELSRARRYGRPFVLAYVDVRGLKGVNDSEGHLAGDRLLTAAAQLLRDSARADDIVGRLGGDEMGLLLVEQSGEGAKPVIDRIHRQVAVRRPEVGLRSPWDLTVGTAVYPGDGKTVKELIATADRRLYEQRGIALT